MLRRLLHAYLHVFREYPSLRGMGIIVVVVQLGWSGIMAVIPLYLANHFHRKNEIGLILLAFLGVETLLKPTMGNLGDKLGRKPVLLAGCLIALLATACLYVTTVWWWFLPLMSINGLAAAAIWPAVSAYMGERVPAADKAGAMSIFEGGYMIGFGFGSAAGLFIGGQYGNHNVFLIATGLFLLAAVMTLFMVEGGRYGGHEVSERVGGGKQRLLPGHGAWRLLRDCPLLLSLMLIYLVSQIATTALAPIATLYAEQELGRTQEEMAELLIGPAILIALLGVGLGRFADRIGKVRASQLSFVTAPVCLALLLVARSPQPGTVEAVTPQGIHVKQQEAGNLRVGDLVMVRREGRQIASLEVRETLAGGFVGDSDSAADIVPGDRVFQRARQWQVAVLIGGVSLLLIAYALGAPSMLGLASAVAPLNMQGQALGLMNAAQGVGSCLGIISGPQLYARVSPQAPIWLAIGVYAVCIVYTAGFIREPPMETILPPLPDEEPETALVGQGAKD